MDHPAPPEDGMLLDRVRQGDRTAVATLMQRHNRTLWRVARGILRDEAEAEDAVQDAYVRAFTALDGFRGESSVGTWLARIVINEALRRAGRRHPTTGLDALDESLDTPADFAPPPSPEQQAARAQVRRLVEQAVDALPAAFRSVFMLRVVEQMSVEETAAMLGIPPATVRTRLHRANQHLRVALGAAFGPAFDGAFPFGGARCEQLTAAVVARLGQTSQEK